jgi:hypothetical protein
MIEIGHRYLRLPLAHLALPLRTGAVISAAWSFLYTLSRARANTLLCPTMKSSKVRDPILDGFVPHGLARGRVAIDFDR